VPTPGARCACRHVTFLPTALLLPGQLCPAQASFQTMSKPMAADWSRVGNGVVCGCVAFPCPLWATRCIISVLCPPVPQVPVPIHGPAGRHVTQRGAAFRVSQPLLHSCWLRVLGREVGGRRRSGAGTPHVFLCPVLWVAGCPREPVL